MTTTATRNRPPVSDPDAKRRIDQRAAAARRRRNARAALCEKTHVLADILPGLPKTPSTKQVCDALNINARTTLHNTLHRHRDEMIAAGWNPEKGTFSQKSVILLCLFIRATTSRKAAEVTEAIGARRPAIKFHGNKVPHVRNCQSMIKRAYECAERIRDEDPAELWHALGQLDPYQLQGVTVALAAMVPVDQPDLTKWLTELAPSKRHEGSGAASGLAKLIPTEDQAKGVPVGLAAAFDDIGAGE